MTINTNLCLLKCIKTRVNANIKFWHNTKYYYESIFRNYKKCSFLFFMCAVLFNIPCFLD